jgi:hypothetical protein
MKGESMSFKTLTSLDLALLLGLGSASLATAAPPPACQTVEAKDLAPGAQKIDTGLITADQSSWSASFSAGQAVWIVLKNGNVHVTPVVVRFTENAIHPKVEKRISCESQVAVLPQGTTIVKTTSFGTKIPYNVEVALPNEPPVDSAVIGITVQALPAEGGS